MNSIVFKYIANFSYLYSNERFWEYALFYKQNVTRFLSFPILTSYHFYSCIH